jgi:aminoglycoside/choline kinase family phosphotransferase
VLLEDFGNRTFLDELQNDTESLYSRAIDSLVKLQSGPILPGDDSWHPPAYDGKKLIAEMSLFSKWFIARHLGQTLHEPSFAVWLHTQQYLASACLEQPQVWVHRDFHSRNLMILDSFSAETTVKELGTPLGVIDFQDCVIGPIGYDLASIFKDCYIEWPREKQHEWLEQYRLKTFANSDIKLKEFSLEQLIRWVDFAGLQRHLKVLGIFCRLNYRDGKDNYLDDLPLVAKYVIEVLDIYPELETFKNHFEGHIRQAL